MVLHPVPAFSDNYVWVLHNDHAAVVVDPGEAEGVLAYLQAQGLRLETILVTHHHGDHTGGVQALSQATGSAVVAPAREWPGTPAQRVSDGDTLSLLGLKWRVLDVPGHTAGHVAYVAESTGTPPQRWLFCGDTLFSAGCGRVFEGTPEQMLDSLDTLATLPDDTWVCCAHEYTLGNLRFARAVDPHNAALAARQAECEALRATGQPTLPCRLGDERATNPFLRVRHAALQQAARQHTPGAQTPAEVFAALRTWKNTYQ